jgi:hypothetical protein
MRTVLSPPRPRDRQAAATLGAAEEHDGSTAEHAPACARVRRVSGSRWRRCSAVRLLRLSVGPTRSAEPAAGTRGMCRWPGSLVVELRGDSAAAVLADPREVRA